MAEHNELGKRGEELALNYLQKEGYTILKTNYTFQKAEIDIIAQKGGILAVVEVKTRSSIDFGLPQDFVKPKKIQLLVKAIDAFITQQDLDLDVRFDIIAITTSGKTMTGEHQKDKSFVIEHLIDAFYHF